MINLKEKYWFVMVGPIKGKTVPKNPEPELLAAVQKKVSKVTKEKPRIISVYCPFEDMFKELMNVMK